MDGVLQIHDAPSLDFVEESVKDFDDDDSIVDPNFVASDSDDASDKSDIALETKCTDSQFEDCVTLQLEIGEEPNKTSATQTKNMRKKKETLAKAIYLQQEKLYKKKPYANWISVVTNARTKYHSKISSLFLKITGYLVPMNCDKLLPPD